MYMHQLVFTNTCLAFKKTRFISIYVDEVTIMDCQSWFKFSCSWLEAHTNFIDFGASGEW